MKELEAAEATDCALLSKITVEGTSMGRGWSGANIAQSRFSKTPKLDAEMVVTPYMLVGNGLGDDRKKCQPITTWTR